MSPPKENYPSMWVFNLGVKSPREVITSDLEEFAKVGISSFMMIGYGASITPARPYGDTSLKGKMHGVLADRLRWALHESHRLGLGAWIMLGPGGCGNSDCPPEHAQKELILTTARAAADANGAVRVSLPKRGAKETPRNPDGSPKHYWDVATLAVPVKKGFVQANEVIDVSGCLDRASGTLVWKAPAAGGWLVIRAGAVPKIFGFAGCFIDHMSKEAFDAHWANVVTPLLEQITPEERSALVGVWCDSWEAGNINWTPGFAEEFRKRRGYDFLPMLPVKAGVKMVSAERSRKFARDWNVTIGELIAENHYAYQKEVANRHGLLSSAEGCGPHLHHGDARMIQGRADVAMGEFWMPSPHRPEDSQRFMLRDSATAAHVYGMGVVESEAFTTMGTHWEESPAMFKPCADRAFCDGLTRICYHGMLMSINPDELPGDTRRAGAYYSPKVTWWKYSAPMNLYFARCSWMLSQGRFAADCLLYAGDAVNLFAGLKTPADGLGEGFDYDFCPTELLLQARVEDGQVVLPSGMRYRVLMLSDRNPKTNGHMRPGPMKKVQEYPPVGLSVGEAAMLKMRELVEAGATLVGPRPSGPTSMNESSARYHAAADALWGPRHGEPASRRLESPRQVGKGRVFRDRAAARANQTPDVTFNGPSLDWIHRTLSDGTDIYFVSNQKGEAVKTTVLFRQPEGKAVELWDAVTGTRSAAGTAPRVELELPPFGSTFVVFRSRGSATLPQETQRARRPLSQCAAKMAAPHTGRTGVSPVQTLPGPWSVTFDPTWGGPKEPVAFPALTDWTARPEPGIRHYSGTATYRTTFDAPFGWKPGEPLQIDLEMVHDVADVLVNGKLAGTAWTAPYAVTASNIKEKGNTLEVRVTNLWPNRLIYDAGLPEGERLTRTNINPYKSGDSLLPSGLLGSVQIRMFVR